MRRAAKGGVVQGHGAQPHDPESPRFSLLPEVAESKRCPVCEETRPVDDFAVDRSRRDGRMVRCKSCDRARNQQYYAANSPEILARTAARRSRAVERPRKCARCGEPATSSRHWYCDLCRFRNARTREAVRRRRREAQFGPGTTTKRGYGASHQKLRARWAAMVALGVVRCARCGELIAAGSPWDLGHVDDDRSRYAGPEHRRCNRSTARRRTHRTSRAW